jgi:hypothetical protein
VRLLIEHAVIRNPLVPEALIAVRGVLFSGRKFV